MTYRSRVLVLLCLLMVVTYLDRVCISVAGPRIQESLHLSLTGWGWVTGIFTLSYAAFEIPSGMLGDRIGPRKVLTRIVLWWSGFTTLTGLVKGYPALLATRFLFGMGEAGAFPNAAIAISRWFPAVERGRAFGIALMFSQVGGALTPFLVVPIQARYGWRASFYVFGILGVAWSAVWYGWFRDSPGEKPGLSAEEREVTRGLTSNVRHGLPWGIAMRSGNFRAVLAVAICYVYTLYFFQSWFHTYLVKAHGYSENDLLLSSLPFFVGAAANFLGGITSAAAVRSMGLKNARRYVGAASLAVSAICMVAVMLTGHWLAVLILLSVAYAGITFQQPTMFAVCLDIGGPYAGAVAGAMNTAAMAGSFVSTLMFGYLVSRFGSYNAPFVPMATLLAAGAWLWIQVDASEELIPLSHAAGA